MSKNYSKMKSRSRRNRPAEMKGKVLGITEGSVQLSLPMAEVLAGIEESVESVIGQAGLLVIKALLDDEVNQVVGDRYRHKEERTAFRHGQEEGHVVFAGRKVPVQRPRVRSVDGKEIQLKRYGLFRQESRMQDAVERRILAGVSSRKYEEVLDGVCEGYGVRKSSVSRHFKAASGKKLKELLERPLGELDLLVVMIDGIEFRDTTLVVAMGYTTDGHKHILGLWQGATENSTLVKALLEDLVDRGLRADQNYLFVLDGSKALHKGVRAVFGKHAVVQRCHQHKERNVLSYLPKEYHRMVKQRLRAAWGMREYDKAKKALLHLVDYLATQSVSAARSLEEGLEETLTLHRLGVPDRLRKSFKTTNPIESCFAASRNLCHNVKRWSGESMIIRWAGTVLLTLEKGFRRVNGHRELPMLVAALRKDVDLQEVAA